MGGNKKKAKQRNKARGGGNDGGQQHAPGVVRRPEQSKPGSGRNGKGQKKLSKSQKKAIKAGVLPQEEVKEYVREDGFLRHQEIPLAHKEAILCICMAGDSLYTGGRDKMLKRWKPARNPASGRFEVTSDLEMKLADQCSCIVYVGDWIFCGLANGTIKGYNKAGPETELLGHSKSVKVILVHQNILISGGTDGTVRCWLPEGTAFNCNNTITEGIPGAVQAMCVIGEHLWIGGASGIVVMELSSLRVLQAFGPKKFVAGLLPYEGHLVVLYADGCIRIFEAAGGAEKPCNFAEAPLPAGPSACLAGLEIGPRLLVGHGKGQVSSITLPMFQLKKYWQTFQRCKVQCMTAAGADGIFLIGAENGTLQIWQRQEDGDL
jgi:WD40 repeat protein